MYGYSTFPFKLLTTCLLLQWGMYEKPVCCLNQASHVANTLCWLLMNMYLHTLIALGQWWQLEELFLFIGWAQDIVLVMCSKPAMFLFLPREEIFCTGGLTSISGFLVSRQSLHLSCWAPSFGCLTLRQYLLLDHLCRPQLRCPLGWGKSS